MSDLYTNLVNLINQTFYKTKEKPVKYSEWLESEYSNGVWYINEEPPTIVVWGEITNVSKTFMGSTQCHILITTSHELFSSQVPTSWTQSSTQITRTVPISTLDTNNYRFGVSIPSYYDETNNILYTGSTWATTDIRNI